MGEQVNKVGAQMVIGGGAAVVVASFLPWAKVTAVFVGSVEITGMDGGDGVLSLIAGSLLLALGWSALGGSRPKVTTILTAIAVGLLSIFEFGDISSRAEDIGEFGRVDYGIGLYLLLAGAGVALIGAVKLPTPRTTAPDLPDAQHGLAPAAGDPAAPSLEVLSEMHESGELDDRELTAARRQVLGID